MVVRLKKQDDTASRIVYAATTLFADKGYDGVSTKEICDKADVNIAAIHYHFGSKEELYVHVIKSFSEERIFQFERILRTPTSLEEFKLILRMLMEDLLDGCAANTNLARMVMREVELERSACMKVFEDTFLRFHYRVVKFFAEAVESKLIASHVNPETAAILLFGSVKHFVTTPTVFKKALPFDIGKPKSREALIESVLSIMLIGMTSHKV